jgi:NhaP-type Na+/H+ or K+/H+ antiporter
MTVSIPLVAILGAGAYIAWRFMGLRAWHAVMCLLFGFFLAATDAAPQIRQLVTGIVRWLTGA